MVLEEIIAEDAKICASKFWWRVHDEGRHDEAAALFVEQETIIVHYVGRDLSEQNKRTTQYHFANALRTYDDFAEALKKGDDAKSLQKILLAHFVETYKALGYGEEVAKHNCEWWINWAYSRISQKKVDVVDDAQSETLFRLYFDKVVD